MEFHSTVSSKNQVTLPADVRKQLGIKSGSKVAFVVDDTGVHLKPVQRTIADFFGYFPSHPDESDDLKTEIEAGMAEEAERIARDMAQS